MTESSKYLVVGAGLAGAAAAWKLAAAGHEVTILERDEPASHRGSSHGSARIFRYAYADEFYARSVAESRTLWNELEQLHGADLIDPVGAVDHGTHRDPEQLARVLVAVGVEHNLLTADQARQRWPQIQFESRVLWQPGAGVIDAEGSVNAMVAQARKHGARLLTDWTVASVQERSHGYRLVRDNGETFDAENVVIAAGGWLPQLLGQLPLPSGFLAGIPKFTVRQEQVFHFHYREANKTRQAWPTFIHNNGNIEVYGLPGGRDAGFDGQKVAEYNGGRIIPSAADQTGVVDPANRERVVDYVRMNLPGLDPEPYAETTCLFTNTPNEDFVIDRAGGLTIVSPCSGHGAKFAPLIGEWAAGLATGTRDVPARFRAATL
ncbi:FAD-dependent oxidoreductase [Pseudarthrobacter sp. J1738]|uniref:FAD-dependent oxidoreductase n=1 Tax=Pseudarthrobacter sp. J1738 TaxID=3420446 RepID=UPI003D2AC542